MALWELHRLKSALVAVLVCGIKGVTRAIITYKEPGEKTPAEKADGRPAYKLLVEGEGLLDVLGIRGVKV